MAPSTSIFTVPGDNTYNPKYSFSAGYSLSTMLLQPLQSFDRYVLISVIQYSLCSHMGVGQSAAKAATTP
jgi:hypothetical protein